MDFDERCKLVEQCLPESPFKEQIVKLHTEMLDCIAGLEAACDSLSADIYSLHDV